MSGIIAVYGLVVSVLIAGGRKLHNSLPRHDRSLTFTSPTVKPTDYSLYAGFIHLGAGLACGFTGLAAGYAIGFVGDSVRHHHTSRVTVCLTVSRSAYEHTSMNRRCLCLWCSSSFSARFLGCTGEFFLTVHEHLLHV